MENSQKSSIQSTSVTAGAVIGKAGSPLKRALPWRILICSDLGYTGETPEPLTAAALPDLMGSHTIRLQGTVLSVIDGRPLFIDYAVNGIDDLREKKLATQLPSTKPLVALQELLESVLSGTIDTQTAVIRLDQCNTAASPMYDEAARLLSPPAGAPSGQVQAAAPKPAMTRIDSILAAIDTSGLDSRPDTLESGGAVDRLAAAVTSQRSGSLPPERIRSLIERITASINAEVAAVCSSSFFNRVRSSWIAVRHCAKAIGRHSDIELSVVSLPLSEAGDGFPAILDDLAGAAPDLIVLDYPLQMTNAHMDLLTTIAAAADRCRAMVLTSCSSADELHAAIHGCDTMRPILASPRYIPYNRLRKNPVSRCLLFALPELMINSGDSLPASVGGSWMILYALVARLVNGSSPFEDRFTLAEIPDTILGAFPLQNTQGISMSAVEETAVAGLTLLSRTTTAENGTIPLTIIDPAIADSRYTNFNYNLLLNRLTRLSAAELSRLRGFGDRSSQAQALEHVLLDTLSTYRLISSKDDIQVTVDDDQAISVAIDSPKAFNGMSLTIQFGFGG
jgi:hypothetical protein